MELAEKDASRAKHENNLLGQTVDDLAEQLEDVTDADDTIIELKNDNQHLSETVDRLHDVLKESTSTSEADADQLEDEVAALRLNERKLIAELECWERVANTLMTQVGLQAQLTSERDEAKRQSNELANRLTNELRWDDCDRGVCG